MVPFQPGQSERVLSRAEVRACDQVAMERFAVPGIVLMENAGRTAAEHILAEYGPPERVLVVAGAGNNAGDGFVVARHLCNAGVNVDVLLCKHPEKIGGDALTNLRIAEKLPLPCHRLSQGEADAVRSQAAALLASTSLVVDALLGTGTSGPPRFPFDVVIEAINASGKPVVALDIPSGLDCDEGQPQEPTITATSTVTFAALKRGFQHPEARRYTGRVVVAGIGIRTDLLCDVAGGPSGDPRPT